MIKTGREKIEQFKWIINFLVTLNSVFPKKANYFLLKLFRNTNGILGLLIRYILVKNLAKSCGDNVSIQPNVFLFCLEKISFGNNISVHPMCYIDGTGEIDIHNNVSIAHGTSILSTNHTWKDNTMPIKYNEETFGKVTINEDVWIGCGCRILSGISIATRCVIAAGAVLNKSTQSHSVYGGVPAKLIKKIE